MMNDWYIDRSKNFYFSEFDEVIKFFKEKATTSIDSSTLIQLMSQSNLFSEADGNPNAALTRYRDHGIIRKDNSLGDAALAYANGKLNLSELITNLFIKRPAKKDHSPNVKPFLIICKVFDFFMEMDIDPDDIFITQAECYEYLYPCNSYSEVTYELIEKILLERKYDTQTGKLIARKSMTRNEIINISIWFNALKRIPVFLPDEDSSVLRPNLKQYDFFRYLSVNADEFIETPSSNNKDLYDYYCDENTGLIEVLPKVIIPYATVINNEDIQILFEYLFGYKKRAGFDYKKYVKYECFGIFFPFITMPRLVIHIIEKTNKVIGRALFDYVNISNGYLEAFSQGLFEYSGIDAAIKNKKLIKYKRMIVPKKVKNNFPLNIIFYGAPGTGKTYTTAEHAVAIINDIKVDNINQHYTTRNKLMDRYNDLVDLGQIVFTTFHQSYGYEDFIQGLRPVNINGKFYFETIDGVFKSIADKAIQDQQNNYVIIIDEINRANISKVFGELITLIEEDKRWGEINALSVTLPSGEQFAVPNNLYILGTMNSADKSISLIDTALRRRFKFIEVVPKASLVKDEKLRTVLERINLGLVKEFDSTDLLIGHAYFMDKTSADLCDIMNNNIIPLLYEYYYDNSKKVGKQVSEAIEGFDLDISKSTVERIKLTKKA